MKVIEGAAGWPAAYEYSVNGRTARIGRDASGLLPVLHGTLFHPLDADDPAAAERTFEHLAKGLVRVVLPLPDNMDVIDLEGAVITPADRKIFVWRGVPSVADTAFSAPYQLDGREATYLTLNGSGALLWRKLANSATRDELVEALLVTYDVDQPTAAADTDAFLSALSEQGLLAA